MSCMRCADITSTGNQVQTPASLPWERLPTLMLELRAAFCLCACVLVSAFVWGLVRLEWLSAVGDRAVRSLKCAEIVSAGDKARASGLFESASSFPKPSDAVPAGPSHGDQPPEPGEAQGTPAAAGTDSKGGSSATEGVAGSAIGAVTGALLKTLGPLHALDAASIPLLVPKELRRMIIHLADCGQDVAALFDLKGLGLDLSWLDDDVIPGVSQRLPRGLHLGAGAEAPAPGSPRKLPRLPSLAPGAPVSIETEVGPIRECLDTGEPFPTISGAGGGAGGVSPFSGPGPLSHPLPPRAHSNLGPGSSSSTPAHPESPSVSPGDTETVPRAAAATPVGLSNLGPSAGGVPPADLGSVANTGALDGQRGGGGPSGAILAAQLEHPQLRGLKVKPLVLVPRSPSLNSSPTAAGHSPGHGAPGLLTHRAVAKALVSFLLALPEPVVPEKPAQWEVDATDEPWGPGAAAALLASSLPPLEMAVVDALLSLIHSLLRNRIANRLAVQELGEHSALSCLRSSLLSSTIQCSRMHHCIVIHGGACSRAGVSTASFGCHHPWLLAFCSSPFLHALSCMCVCRCGCIDVAGSCALSSK